MVTAKLICVFVFAYAKSRFSHIAAQIGMHFQLDDDQPLEYLSEMRQVSIVFMNLVLDERTDSTNLLQKIFELVYTQTKSMHGKFETIQ